MEPYEDEAETVYWTTQSRVPRYGILETVEDSITGTVWHKLDTNARATQLISRSKAYSQWDIRTENTGKKFFWVTDQLLTLLHVQGLEKRT